MVDFAEHARLAGVASGYRVGDRVKAIANVGDVLYGDVGTVTEKMAPGVEVAFQRLPHRVYMDDEDLVSCAHIAPPAGDFEIALDEALASVREVMIDRHKKYGPGNILRHGEYGVVVRLGDKYERLDHSREIDFADESADDTADDIIGYGLIFKMLRAGQWPGQKHPASSE